MAVERDPSHCISCPRCRGHVVLPTLKTSRGSYCLCQACGHVWHHDSTGNDDKPLRKPA